MENISLLHIILIVTLMTCITIILVLNNYILNIIWFFIAIVTICTVLLSLNFSFLALILLLWYRGGVLVLFYLLLNYTSVKEYKTYNNFNYKNYIKTVFIILSLILFIITIFNYHKKFNNIIFIDNIHPFIQEYNINAFFLTICSETSMLILIIRIMLFAFIYVTAKLLQMPFKNDKIERNKNRGY